MYIFVVSMFLLVLYQAMRVDSVKCDKGYVYDTTTSKCYGFKEDKVWKSKKLVFLKDFLRRFFIF